MQRHGRTKAGRRPRQNCVSRIACREEDSPRDTRTDAVRREVAAQDAGAALTAFLADWLKVSRRQAKRLLDERRVFVNRRRIWMAHHALRRGDRVEVVASPVPAERVALRILHEDEDYLVVDKPPGLLSNGEGSVLTRLREQTGRPALVAAHRLDRDTSGCLLVAADSRACEDVIPLFRARDVKKVYHALVRGRLPGPERKIDMPLQERRAVSHVRVLDAGREATHVAVRIETGRTHQIRAHLAAIGHPVLGDRQYGTGAPAAARALAVRRQMLHASTLEFEHPRNGRRVRATAPLPRDFRNCLKAFGLR